MAVQYPEFVDNAQFIQMDSSVSETEQLKAMLNNLTRVHGLTANKFDSLSDLIHQYLKCGCEIFGLETGIVSEIDNQESYHILDIISPIEVLHKGQQFPLENTYCREVYKNQTVLGFPEVGNLEFMNCHPVYINLKLEAYLSAPIYVEDKLFGTLNFTSTQARPNGFSKNEHNLILLMANSIGNYIQLRNNNERLEELNERIMRFVGFVTHDLRNPIGAVLALSQLAQRQIGDEAKLMSMLPKISEVAEDSLELINHILDTTALSTGKLHVELEPVNFEEVVGAAINAVLDFSRENRVSIKTEFSGLATAYCDAKRIQQTLVNLLINSIKYSPQDSEIVVRFVGGQASSYVSVQNATMDKNLENDNLKGIYDSFGLGLEIVKTVLNAHNSDLKIEQSNGQFEASFVLTKPR